MNPIKRNIYYIKMLLDGRYYAKTHRKLLNTYLAKQINLPLDNMTITSAYISNNFKALHTLIIRPYQAFSFNQIFKKSNNFTKCELNTIADCLNMLVSNTSLTVIEKHTINNSIIVDGSSHDLKFINNTPYKHQIMVSLEDKELYLNLYTEIKKVRNGYS